MKFYKLDKPQLKMVANISESMGQAIFASVILPFAFQLDKIDILVVLLGLVTALLCWLFSIVLIRGKK